MYDCEPGRGPSAARRRFAGAIGRGGEAKSHNEKARTPMNHAKTATSKNAKPARAMLASFLTDH
jgi:hypothetical protein